MNFIDFINTYPFLILLMVLIPALIIIIYIAIHRPRDKSSPVTIINKTNNNKEEGDEENLEVSGRFNEEAMRRIFGLGRHIKQSIIGFAIAIPFAVLSYIVSENLDITVASLFIFIIFGYLWAKKWVKPEGVQIILDGDIDPKDPAKGVQHIDYIIPYEQWKYIIFTDQGGAYPIKTIDGMAYRASSINFWDPEQRIVKDITLAWMHSPHSNFEQEHELNHKLTTWLKISLKELNAYKHLKEILAIMQGRMMTEERERIRLDARTSPNKSEYDIQTLMGQIKEYDKEIKVIIKTGKETKEKVEKSPEDTGQSEGGDGNAGE